MPGSGPCQYLHIMQKRPKSCQRIPVNKDLSKVLRKYVLLDKPEGVICNRCSHECYKIKDQTAKTNSPSDTKLSHQKERLDKVTSSAVSSPSSVSLPIQSIAKSHA